jgi:hypothetical protein
MGPTELEYKINTSIGLTLNFFNDTLPNIFASVYAFSMYSVVFPLRVACCVLRVACCVLRVACCVLRVLVALHVRLHRTTMYRVVRCVQSLLFCYI